MNINKYILIGVVVCLPVILITVYLSSSSETHQNNNGTIELTKSFRNELEALITKNSDIVAAMPAHPKSSEVLDDVLAIIGYEFGKDPDECMNLAIELFRDSNVGLFALKEYLGKETPEPSEDLTKTEYAERLCTTYPDSRASSMALNYLLQKSADASSVCAHYRESYPGTRLAVYCFLKEGDRFKNNGEEAKAIFKYISVWRQDPERADSLYARIMPILNQHSLWRFQTLFPVDSLDTPAMPTMLSQLEYLVERIADDNGDSDSEKWIDFNQITDLLNIVENEELDDWYRMEAGVIAVKECLSRGQVEVATGTMKTLLEVVSNFSDDSDYLSGIVASIALLSIDHIAPTQFDEDSEGFARLQTKQQFLVSQKEFLNFWIDLQGRTEPNAHAMLSKVAAQKRLENADIDGSVSILESALNTDGIEPSILKNLVLDLARIYAEEWDELVRAGKLCADYSESISVKEHTRELRIQAGNYFFKGEDYDQALTEFKKLGQESNVESDQELSEYMVALCRLQRGEDTSAINNLEDFAFTYPDSRFSDHALFLAASSHLSSMRYQEARNTFEQLISRYPDSRFASRAQDYMAKLKSIN